ncbi:EpsG family protein [Cupriavidus sp. WKF15]|uniref:EpsG family protein n=1 Tax=Cupriavidus sp. WKF15 TaxID=3032282 RepID=UPI0023E245D3|nr:EpsG family protein [Cupriavidus sp. WKF15]WER47331.1 EpsG family protein [Cupriavidus sp. WKF15]
MAAKQYDPLGASSRSISQPIVGISPLGIAGITALGVSIFFVPALMGIALAVIGSLFVKHEKLSFGWISVALVFILLLAINLCKSPDGDLQWYLLVHRKFASQSFSDVISSGDWSLRWSEFVYYFSSFVVSRVFDGSYVSLIVLIHSLIYGVYIAALVFMSRAFGLKGGETLLCIIFGMVFAITFTQTTQLVRQYICGSLILLAAVLLLNGRWVVFLVLSIAAVFVHNSAVILLALVLASYSASKAKSWRAGSLVFMFIAGAYVFGYLLSSPQWSFISEVSLVEKNDGEISVAIKLMDGALLFIFLALGRVRDESGRFVLRSRAYRYWRFMYLSYFVFLIAVSGSPLLSLRFYFYIEWFRILPILYLIIAIRKIRMFGVFALSLIVVAVIGWALRVTYGAWDYGGSVDEISVNSLPGWISRISENNHFK